MKISEVKIQGVYLVNKFLELAKDDEVYTRTEVANLLSEYTIGTTEKLAYHLQKDDRVAKYKESDKRYYYGTHKAIQKLKDHFGIKE